MTASISNVGFKNYEISLTEYEQYQQEIHEINGGRFIDKGDRSYYFWARQQGQLINNDMATYDGVD